MQQSKLAEVSDYLGCHGNREGSAGSCGSGARRNKKGKIWNLREGASYGDAMCENIVDLLRGDRNRDVMWEGGFSSCGRDGGRCFGECSSVVFVCTLNDARNKSSIQVLNPSPEMTVSNPQKVWLRLEKISMFGTTENLETFISI